MPQYSYYTYSILHIYRNHRDVSDRCDEIVLKAYKTIVLIIQKDLKISLIILNMQMIIIYNFEERDSQTKFENFKMC